MSRRQRPHAATAYSPSGSSEWTSSGETWSSHADYRPGTPNLGTSGRHPGSDYNNPPFTTNRDPSSNHRSYAEPSRQNTDYTRTLEECQKDLRAERLAHQKTQNDSRKQIAGLRSDADQLHKQYEEAKQTIEDQKKTIEDQKKTIEDVLKEAARLCKEQKKYRDANKHFFKLSNLKLDEAFDKGKNIEAAHKAENSALNFQQQGGEMLELDGEHAAAEIVFKKILERREQLFGPDHIKRYKESRDTMLSLARVLRKQHDDKKTMEAARLYHMHAWSIGIKSRDKNSCEWAFCNTLGLTGALYECREYHDAKYYLGLICGDRSMISASYASELDKEVLKILDLLRCRMDPGNRDHLIKALAVICKPDPAEVSSRLLPCYIELGKLLSESTASGNSHNCYDSPLSYLQRAWRCRDRLSVEQRRNTLWSMALVYASLGKWKSVKQWLDELRKFDLSHNYDCSISSTSTSSTTVTTAVTDSTSPTKAMISALTARQQLNVGEFAAAAKTAKPLVIIARDASHNITPITTSNLLLPYTALHQTDTLIKALTKRGEKKYFTQAKEIWEQVYAAAKRGDMTDGDEIKMFAATGRSLADEWVEVRRNSGTRLQSPGEIRKKVQEMEQWAVAPAAAAAAASNTSSGAV